MKTIIFISTPAIPVPIIPISRCKTKYQLKNKWKTMPMKRLIKGTEFLPILFRNLL
jgi:hypothetical protein